MQGLLSGVVREGFGSRSRAQAKPGRGRQGPGLLADEIGQLGVMPASPARWRRVGVRAALGRQLRAAPAGRSIRPRSRRPRELSQGWSAQGWRLIGQPLAQATPWQPQHSADRHTAVADRPIAARRYHLAPTIRRAQLQRFQLGKADCDHVDSWRYQTCLNRSTASCRES